MKTIVLFLLVCVSCSAESFKVGDGKKFHSVGTNSMTVCGMKISSAKVAQTNAVDCKLCLRSIGKKGVK